jgi:hypothetical protein
MGSRRNNFEPKSNPPTLQPSYRRHLVAVNYHTAKKEGNVPITISTGLSKKIGLPDFGSLGATCTVSFEAGHDLLDSDLAAFHAKVRNAYIACAQAVKDELAREQEAEHAANGNNHIAVGSNGQLNGYTAANSPNAGRPERSTSSQLRFYNVAAACATGRPP